MQLNQLKPISKTPIRERAPAASHFYIQFDQFDVTDNQDEPFMTITSQAPIRQKHNDFKT